MRLGTAGLANSGKRANSRRRPSATDGPRSGPRSVKNRNGSRAPPSSPLKRRGRGGGASPGAGGGAHPGRRAGRGDGRAASAVADLVVVLQEAHERGRRQVGAELAAQVPTIQGSLALEGEALGETAPEVRQ